MITHVAIKYNDKIYSLPQPFRHHDVIRQIGGIYGEDIQGFLTDKGHFLNRAQAFVHAQFHGQVKPRGVNEYNGNELYSEDLW
jgi:hypothetical protein